MAAFNMLLAEALATFLLASVILSVKYFHRGPDVLKAFAGEDGQITVDMGSPLMGWEDIPLSEQMDVRGVDVKVGPIDNPWLSRPAVVSMGTPHAVFFVKNIDDYDIPAIGPLVEWHPTFPEGVNVGFAQVIDRQNIRLRVWERGAAARAAREVQIERTERALDRLHRGLQRQFAAAGLREDGAPGSPPTGQQSEAGGTSPGNAAGIGG